MNKMPTETMTGAEAEAAEAPKVKRKRRKIAPKSVLRPLLLLLVPALLVIGGGYYWLTSGGEVSTDDAQVKQDIVSVSAQVNGPIVQVVRPRRRQGEARPAAVPDRSRALPGRARAGRGRSSPRRGCRPRS